MLTTFGEDEVLWGAIEAGAVGFVLKDSSAEDLIAAVRAVAGGGAWFDPAVAPRVLDRYRRVVAPAARDAARLDLLTDREHDVLRLMARGATNSEIAASLFVAEATVKSHVGSIFMKLDVRDRRRGDRVRVRPRRGQARARRHSRRQLVRGVDLRPRSDGKWLPQADAQPAVAT